MDGEGDKLKQLHAGDVPLPPQVLLHLWPHGGHQVVEIHDHVHAHVQEHEEGGVSTANPSKTNRINVNKSKQTILKGLLEKYPAGHWHHCVVDHMQGGQLVVLLAENKEEGVHEICELGEEIPPDNAGSCQAIL